MKFPVEASGPQTSDALRKEVSAMAAGCVIDVDIENLFDGVDWDDLASNAVLALPPSSLGSPKFESLLTRTVKPGPE